MECNSSNFRFTSEQIGSMPHCTPATLKDLTRTKGKRPPIFTPEYPAEGSGYKDLFSFGDVMRVALIIEFRKAGIERGWIQAAIHAGKAFSNTPELDPFNANFLSDLSEKTDSKFTAAESPKVFISITALEGLLMCKLEFENLPKINKMLHTKRIYQFLKKKDFEYVPVNVSHLGPEGRQQLEETAMISVTVNLNRLHARVRGWAKKEGHM